MNEEGHRSGGARDRGCAFFAATATARPSSATGTDAKQAVNCNSTLRIALVTPLTGGPFLGNDSSAGCSMRLKQSPQFRARTAAADRRHARRAGARRPLRRWHSKYVADQRVIGVIGPATSGAVASTSSTYLAAGMAHISPSATRTSLTKGRLAKGRSAFFRVVPGDFIQGPSDARS